MECGQEMENSHTSLSGSIKRGKKKNGEKKKACTDPHKSIHQQKSSQTLEGSSEKSDKGWKCKLCQTVCGNMNILCSHILSEHVKIKAPTCLVCDASLILNETAVEHIALHCPMQCALCKKENIPTLKALEEHLTESHSNDKMCTVCHAEINQNEDIVMHMLEHQKKMARRKCPMCLKYYILTTPKHLNNKGVIPTSWCNTNHLISHNIKLSELECCFCPYTCSGQGPIGSMKMHLNYEHKAELGYGNLPHGVKNSNGIFSENRKIRKKKKRKKKKTDKVWKCKLCGAEIVGTSCYKLHILSEHVKRKAPACLVCGTSLTLKEHCTSLPDAMCIVQGGGYPNIGSLERTPS